MKDDISQHHCQCNHVHLMLCAAYQNHRRVPHMVQKCGWKNAAIPAHLFNHKLSHTQRLFSLGSSTTLQSLPVTAHAAVYLFSLTPATVPPFDTCILQHITVSGCDSAPVAHSRLLPSLITRQAAISQQRLGITIEVHETESPSRP